MYWLTLDAGIYCDHGPGKVAVIAKQGLVTIDGRPVLVAHDPIGRDIEGCPWSGPGMLPCLLTLNVRRGYSGTLAIDGDRVCNDTLIGVTTGTPPGQFNFSVRNPGQGLVNEV